MGLTDASAGAPAFADVTDNGPQGNINPNQFPISSVATDSSDATGYTAYVTIMGFTGGTGHVWKTTNAGATWIDFTANLPDSPVNAVVVYPPMSQVYVATDVGVFASSTSTPNRAELGPNPSTNQAGFLPNVAVTSLGVFASGGQQLLRASTYGRGMWQFNLVITPDFQLTVSNSPLTVFAGQSASLNGTITAQNGYASSVTLNCVAGTTSPPGTCSPSPASLTPGSKTPFSVTVGGASGDYNFNVQAAGSDSKHITHIFPVSVHLIGFGLTNPSPPSVTVGRGSTSPPVSFKVTAAGSFSQPVTVSCATVIPNAVCTLTPSGPVWPTAGALVSMTAAVSVPGESDTGSSAVTIQATTTGAPSTLTTSFTLNVIANPDFVLSEPSAFPQINAGSTGVSGPISIASQDGFVGSGLTLKCPNTFGPGSCSISPSSVNSFPTTATLTINGTNFAAGSYSLSISGTSGSVVHTLAVPFNVGDYTVSAPSTLAATPGAQVTATLKLASGILLQRQNRRYMRSHRSSRGDVRDFSGKPNLSYQRRHCECERDDQCAKRCNRGFLRYQAQHNGQYGRTESLHRHRDDAGPGFFGEVHNVKPDSYSGADKRAVQPLRSGGRRVLRWRRHARMYSRLARTGTVRVQPFRLDHSWPFRNQRRHEHFDECEQECVSEAASESPAPSALDTLSRSLVDKSQRAH